MCSRRFLELMKANEHVKFRLITFHFSHFLNDFQTSRNRNGRSAAPRSQAPGRPANADDFFCFAHEKGHYGIIVHYSALQCIIVRYSGL